MNLKQTGLPFVLAVLLSACSSDKNASDTNADTPAPPTAAVVPDTHTSQNSLDWAGSYEGILPCDDCAGIRTRLTLGADGIYELHTEQLRPDSREYSASGYFSWLPDGNTVFLGDAGDNRLFAVGEGRLIELNADGSRPEQESENRALLLLSEQQASTDGVTAAFLQDHRWLLESATTGANQRIDALFPKDRPFEFSFSGANVSVSGGCNGLRGSYQINAEGQFVAGRMASTMMACEPALMAADKAMSTLLAKPLRIMLVQGEQATLILLSDDNDVLTLKGRKTPEALYGPGTRVFLEVAAQTVACKNPQSGAAQCLQIREIKYDEQGLKVGQPGAWQPFYGSIEGYQHTPGVRNIVRVNRFQPASTGAEAAAPAVYVLDLVVESESVSQ